MTKVFVTILNFNSNQITTDCLQSLEEINKVGFELNAVVVDNASKKKVHGK